MADIRIKDLATTATTTASDDFMAVDGTTNGTRKMNAAAPAFLTSVTTPSLTSPAGNNLTLGLGTGGTALTLTNSTLAATFAASVMVNGATTAAAGAIGVTSADPSVRLKATGSVVADQNTYEIRNIGAASSNYLQFRTVNDANSVFTNRMSLWQDGGLYLGTSPAVFGSPGAGGLDLTGKLIVRDTTAGSAGAGALVVTGGLATGAASYIGGALTANGTLTTGASGGSDGGLNLKRASDGLTVGSLTLNTVSSLLTLATAYSFITFTTESVERGRFTNTGMTVTGTLSTTGAATFSGTVSPQQATTAAAPAYVKGAIYFDTTLNKLRVGGATAWETITSV